MHSNVYIPVTGDPLLSNKGFLLESVNVTATVPGVPAIVSAK